MDVAPGMDISEADRRCRMLARGRGCVGEGRREELRMEAEVEWLLMPEYQIDLAVGNVRYRIEGRTRPASDMVSSSSFT